MKKLFDKVGGKKRETPLLVGKVVLVGQYSVKVEALIGEGGFASIYRCVDMRSGHTFALKHMRLGADADAIKEVQQEAKTMARLKGHPNILNLHAVAFAGPAGAETDGFMLLDYCPTTLLEVMQRSNFVLDDFLVYEVFQDVAWAVAHMHKCNPPLAHRDLKAENVLRNSEGRWVICDFGSSTARAQVYDTAAEIATEEDNIRRTTTPAYRAPEMWDLYSRQRIDTAVDVWALGVLLYVLAFGKLPFQGDSKLSILYGKYDMPAGRPAAMRSLIQDMLQVNPKDRPDIFQVISKLDILRNVLSGEGPIDTPPAVLLPTATKPALPPPQQRPQPQQLPPATGTPHPHTNPHPHPQQMQAAAAQAGAALLPYPAAPHAQLPPGPGGGQPPPQQQQAQLQRMAQPPATANGQSAGALPTAGAHWPNGAPSQGPPPPSPYNAPHVPAHMQPQLQQQQPGPHPHHPHPSPYPPVPLQPGQPQQHSQPPHLQQPGQPRPGAPPPQRAPSRQGSFTPNWPQQQPQQTPPSLPPHHHHHQQQLLLQQQAQQRAPPHPQQQPQLPAAVPSTSAPQLVDLMDAAMEEPVPAAPHPAAVVADGGALLGAGSWEGDFEGQGAVFGAGVRGGGAAAAQQPQDAAGPGPGATTASAALGRSVQVHAHRRTGSLTEPSSLQSGSPRPQPAAAAAAAGAAAAGAGSAFHSGAVGFGDDDVNWGEQPAFGSSSSSHPQQQTAAPRQQQQQQPQPPHVQQQPHQAPETGELLLQVDSLPLASSGSTSGMPPAPQSAGILHSNSNSLTCQRSPLAAATSPLGAFPPALVRNASNASASEPPGEATAAAGAGGTAAVSRGPRAAAAAPPPPPQLHDASDASWSGPVAPVELAVTEAEGLRTQLQRVAAANSHLEGRVRQLEGVVSAQGALIQRLASELRALMQQQQQQVPTAAASYPPAPASAPKPLQQPSSQQQQQQPQGPATAAAAVLQPAGSLSGGSGAGPPRPQSGGAAAGAAAGASGSTRGGSGGGGGGAPASPARAATPLGFDPESWDTFAEPSTSSGSAIYPPLRYEDLA